MNESYILEKKKKLDNGEIKVTDLTEKELEEINKIYNKEIKDLKLKIQKKIME